MWRKWSKEEEGPKMCFGSVEEKKGALESIPMKKKGVGEKENEEVSAKDQRTVI